MTIRVAAYLRVSLDHDGRQFGIDTQRQRIEQEARLRNWAVVREFVDNSVSASKMRGKGTAWHEMLDAIPSGSFDMIIAVDLDRLLRRTSDLVTLIDAGAKVVTLDGEIDLTTADGELRATMLTAFARFEVRHKADRMKRANAKRRREGTPSKVAMKILGFTRDGLHVIEDEARLVRQTFVGFVGNISLNQLARDANTFGYTTSKGRPFNGHSIRTLLRNPRYMGKILFHETGQHFSGRFPAIVDADLWEAAQRKLNDPARRRSAGNQPTQLLSSIAYCGKCGLQSIKVGRADWVFYRCKFGHVSRSLAAVDAMVNAAVVSRLSSPDALQLFLPYRDESLDRDSLRLERVTLQSRLDGLAQLFADGVLEGTAVREQSAQIRSRLNAIDGLLTQESDTPIAEVVLASDVESAWHELDLARRREVVKALMKVTIMPAARGGGFDPQSVLIERNS